jgi:hypothetical protein
MIPAAPSRTQLVKSDKALHGAAFLKLCTRYSMDPETAKLQVALDRLWLEGGYNRLRDHEPAPYDPHDHREEYLAWLQQQHDSQQLHLYEPCVQSMQQDRLQVNTKPHPSNHPALAAYYTTVYKLCQRVQAKALAHEDYINAVVGRQRGLQVWSKEVAEAWAAQQEKKHQEELQAINLLEEKAQRRFFATFVKEGRPPSKLQLQGTPFLQIQPSFPGAHSFPPRQPQQPQEVLQPGTTLQAQPQSEQQGKSTEEEEFCYSVEEEEAIWWAQQRAGFKKYPGWEDLQTELLEELKAKMRQKQQKKMEWEKKIWVRAFRAMPLGVSMIRKLWQKGQERVLP